jgi:transcriptional regulator NrdR family protein
MTGALEGLHCPNCNLTNVLVKDSRISEDGTTRRRRRVCADCGHRYSTMEVPLEMFDGISPIEISYRFRLIKKDLTEVLTRIDKYIDAIDGASRK